MSAGTTAKLDEVVQKVDATMAEYASVTQYGRGFSFVRFRIDPMHDGARIVVLFAREPCRGSSNSCFFTNSVGFKACLLSIQEIHDTMAVVPVPKCCRNGRRTQTRLVSLEK